MLSGRRLHLFAIIVLARATVALDVDYFVISGLTVFTGQQAGFHAFRHFNVAILDSLRVPLKTIQERIGHAITGSFTLDVYGGRPEWEPNLEAARLLGAELEKAVAEVGTAQTNKEEATANGGLTPINEKGSGVHVS